MDDLLKNDISAYTALAEELDQRRTTLVDRIMDVARDYIIPEVDAELPEGYSISEDASEVRLWSLGAYADRGVPTEFYLDLRLCYDGVPISGMARGHNIGEIQHDLQAQLMEISQEHGLKQIVVMTEPIEI